MICLCETFVRPDISSALLALQGYDLVVRRDGKDTVGGKCRGLLVYCKTNLRASEFYGKEFSEFTECAGISLPWGKKMLKCVVIYRPPRLPFSAEDGNNTASLCALLENLSGEVVVVGDFNLPGIEWERLHSDSPGERVVLEVIQGLFWTQHVDFATHEDGNILDLVLDSGGLVTGVWDEGRLGGADHSMLKIELAGPAREQDNKELVPDWTKADMEGMKASIMTINWEEKLKGKTGLERWEVVKDIIKEETDRCVPKKARRIGTKPIWMNRNILRLIRKKRRLWRAYTRPGGPLPGKEGAGRDHRSYQAYKEVQKQVQKSVKNAKRKLERKLAKNRKKNNKTYFSYVKSKTKNKVSVGPLVQDEEVVADSEKMANILNAWYCSVFTEEDLSNIPSPEVLYKGDNPLEEVSFTAGKVRKKLANLKPSSAPGPDMIWARVLHELSEVLAEPLAMVFTSCMQEGVVPADWKRANVSPIFKSGSKGVPGNYRPVSLTCIVCKVMESILRDAMVDFLAQHELLRLSQHGFMRRRSTLTNLLEYLEKLTSMVDSGLDMDVVYLDFSKAFDKVPVQRLLRKLNGLGIRGKPLAWVEEWLTGRQQRVVINGKASSWENIKSGVVQGSVLGPCLFLMYINDIDGGVEDLGGFVSKFADDSKWARKVMGEEDREVFQQGLDQLMKWSEDWQMAFNKDKCHVLHLGKKNKGFEYTMGGVKLAAAEWEKDLGVIVHQSLRPSFQCARAAKKANGVLGQLCRGVGYRDKEVFIGLYLTYVRPHLEYAIQAWSPWTAGDKEVLEAVQRRAVKAVTNLKAKTYEDRLRELQLDTLEERRKRGDLLQTYRVLTSKDNVDPTTWFQLCQRKEGEVTTRQTGGHLNVVPQQWKGEIRRNFWSVRVVEPWNSLPDSVKKAESLNCFKNSLDNLQGRGRKTRVGQQ